MANLPVTPLSRKGLGRRALSDLRDRVRVGVDSVPQLQMPAVRWAVGVLLLLVLIGLATAIFALYLMFAPIKLPEPIEGSKAATTQILATDGSVIEQWHGPINRTFVELDDMSKHLREAAIAAEDARFYKRGAVDLRAVMRAAKANLVNASFVQGASTIGQQYAKNVYVGNDPSLSRKVREARVAYRLERDLGKDKVLEGYLNTVYFGRGAYGVEAASKIYFGKAASDVSVSEAALLISMIRSPDGYSPYRHPVKSEARRKWVLERMQGVGFATRQEVREAEEHKPALIPASEAHPRYGWYMDALRTYLLRRYGSEKVYSGGLKVQTTLDPQAQEAAEVTIGNTLPAATDPYAALVSIDPATGYVLAIVGGRDYSDEKYNIALQGRRQPGSAFKPFVLVAALEKGITASAGYRAPRSICLKGWKPSCVSNYGGSGYGYLNLEQATINSVNTVYAQLVLDVGLKKVVDVARRMGIPGPEWMPPRSACRPSPDDACRTRLQPVPAMALGTEEVTPLEMASAYATLAAGGVYREPKLVSRVEDADGRVLEEGPSEPRQAIPPQVAETVNGILSKVIAQGTGTRADFGRPAAGKTGTAQDFSNAWFSGYTPQLATAVWMGHRSGNRPLLNVHGVRQVAGGTMPAEMWREYMKGISDRTPPTVELGKAVDDGALTRDKALAFEGSAADADGMVQGVELSIDGSPFTSAGVVCSKCPGPEVRWTYRSTAALQDGEHVIAIRSFDKPGHRSESQTRTVTVDTRPPAPSKLTATGGADGVKVVFNEPVACGSVSAGSFAITVDGDRATVRSAGCSGGSSTAVDLGLARPVPGGGQLTVDLRRSSRSVADPAGNRAAGAPLRISATNKAPSVELDPSSDRLPFTAKEVEITGAATDPDGTLKGLAVSVDGAGFSSAGLSCRGCGRGASGAWQYRPVVPLSHGKHRLAFRSEDNAGVMSKTRNRTVTVDAVAPSLEAITATGGSPLIKVGFGEPISCLGLSPQAFGASSDGRRVPVESISCSGEATQALQMTLGRPVRGGDRLSITILRRSGAPADVAGNLAGSDSRSAEATNLAPILDLAPSPAGGPVAGSGVEVDGTTIDSDGIIEAVEVSVDSGPYSATGVDCTGCGEGNEVRWGYEPGSPLANGKHTLAFRSVDNAGVRSPSLSRSVTVDSVAPSVQQITSAGGSAVVEIAFSEPVACTASPAAEFQVEVGGRRAGVLSMVCEGPKAMLTLSRVPGGGERVDIVVRGPSRSRQVLTDTAGNPASAASKSVTAANQAPVLRLSTPASELSSSSFQNVGDSITIEGEASDPDGTIRDVEVSIDNGPFSKRGVKCRGCGKEQKVTFAIDVKQVATPGLSNVSVRARDSASALSGPTNSSLSNDDSEPVLKRISAESGVPTLTAAFSEPVVCSTVEAVDFAVRVQGARRPVLTVGCSGELQQELTLRISGRMKARDLLSMEVNGTVQDAAGNLVTPGTVKRMTIPKATKSKG